MHDKVEKNVVFLHKSSFGEQAREADTDDEWDRGDTSTSWSFDKVTKSKRHGYPDKVYADFDITPGDIVHLAIAVWSTGDSFGHDHGAYSECFGVYRTAAEAAQRCNELEKANGNYPWLGYFESLDSAEAYSFIVEN